MTTIIVYTTITLIAMNPIFLITNTTNLTFFTVEEWFFLCSDPTHKFAFLAINFAELKITLFASNTKWLNILTSFAPYCFQSMPFEKMIFVFIMAVFTTVKSITFWTLLFTTA